MPDIFGIRLEKKANSNLLTYLLLETKRINFDSVRKLNPSLGAQSRKIFSIVRKCAPCMEKVNRGGHMVHEGLLTLTYQGKTLGYRGQGGESQNTL